MLWWFIPKWDSVPNPAPIAKCRHSLSQPVKEESEKWTILAWQRVWRCWFLHGNISRSTLISSPDRASRRGRRIWRVTKVKLINNIIWGMNRGTCNEVMVKQFYTRKCDWFTQEDLIHTFKFDRERVKYAPAPVNCTKGCMNSAHAVTPSAKFMQHLKWISGLNFLIFKSSG